MDWFYAHSGDNLTPDETWQLLRDHLRGVADGARRRAAETHVAALLPAATAAGWLHDLGKYRREFQLYIRSDAGYRKGNPLTRHKEAGAARAFHDRQPALALAILGHHGGIPDGDQIRPAVTDGQKVADAVRSEAEQDCEELKTLALNGLPFPSQGFAADLFTRLLFSCLVDADWDDTAAHYRKVKGLPPEPEAPALDPTGRLRRVDEFIAGLADRPLEPRVKAARQEVLAACRAAAQWPSGLFSLTVPTGGGKTLASLTFALTHAAAHGLRRVIYVAPYMTILEQNAGVIRAALGVGEDDPAVFTHYSLAEPPGDDDPNETVSAARRAENWDAPVVVTTNVQFFESLFSNKPGRCRKLHNIARSVIILDECQTLPPGLAAPTCGMLRQIAAETGCTVVLCTATQPAFSHEKLADEERLVTQEIIPPEVDLFTALKRVQVTWPKPTDLKLTWAEVASEMKRKSSALCVVNTKKAARAVYDELTRLGLPGVFHLSTGMCPQHRREKLAKIRGLLDRNASCYVISTQLIEAGVDVDFPFVLREMGPLESVIQAAGRCNREGKLPGAGGRVLVFRSAEGKLPPDRWYNAGRDKVEQIIAAKGDGPQIDDPPAIQDYFTRLYHTGCLDADGVQGMRKTFKFKSVAETYRLIRDAGEPVVVATWETHRAEIAAILVELEAQPRKAIYRKLARFQVNLLPSQLLKVGHLLHEGPGGLLVWDGKYDEDAGIVHEMLDEVLVV